MHHHRPLGRDAEPGWGADGDVGVVLADGASLDTPGGPDGHDLRRRLAATIREGLSPRHVPDELHVVSDVPRTLSGKKLEVPVKRLLLGEALDDVLTEGALQNPEVLDEYVAVARAAT